MRESEEAGLHCGVALPNHGPRGQLSLVTVAKARPDTDEPGTITRLHLLATQLCVAYDGLTRDPNQTERDVVLSARERECLTWTAQGKSAWAISRILLVSEHTVNFHVKSAMRKLGVTTRIQAVAVALRAGLIYV